MPSVPAIAIIDDDEFVRDALQRLIESVGYVTMVFSSADEFINPNRL
jgi:FixJ family two-component response regulator